MILQKLKSGLVAMLALTLFAIPVLSVSTVSAQLDEATRVAACEGLGAVGDECDDTNAASSVESIIGTIISILSFIVGVAAVIMIIIGGFKYVTSNGDSNALSSAKSTILYALVGLVIAAMAQVLVQFVLQRATTVPAEEAEGSVRLVG